MFVSFTERAKKASNSAFSDEVSDNPPHASDSEGAPEEPAGRRHELRLRGRAGVRKGRRKCREYGSSNDSDVDPVPVRQAKSLMEVSQGCVSPVIFRNDKNGTYLSF